MAFSVKEILDFLNNSFILVIGGALLKSIYILFKIGIQTNINTTDIKDLKEFTGYGRRKEDYYHGFRESGRSSRRKTKRKYNKS